MLETQDDSNKSSQRQTTNNSVLSDTVSLLLNKLKEEKILGGSKKNVPLKQSCLGGKNSEL